MCDHLYLFKFFASLVNNQFFACLLLSLQIESFQWDLNWLSKRARVCEVVDEEEWK